MVDQNLKKQLLRARFPMHCNGYFNLAAANYECYPTYNFKGNTGPHCSCEKPKLG